MIFAAFGIFGIWDALSNRNFLKFVYLCVSVIAIFVLFNYDKIFTKNLSRDFGYCSYSLDEHLFNALHYENNSEYNKAIQEIKLALTIIPNDHRALFRLGLMYYHLNNLKAAEENFKEVIKINPLCVDSYYNLGFIYNKQNRPLEAIEMLKRAYILEPDNLGVHFELGTAYKSLGEIVKAKQEFTFALRHLSRWRRSDRAIIENELTAFK
jgi:tetratricopeptide (TPR) repeat protein